MVIKYTVLPSLYLYNIYISIHILIHHHLLSDRHDPLRLCGIHSFFQFCSLLIVCMELLYKLHILLFGFPNWNFGRISLHELQFTSTVHSLISRTMALSSLALCMYYCISMILWLCVTLLKTDLFFSCHFIFCSNVPVHLWRNIILRNCSFRSPLDSGFKRFQLQILIVRTVVL